MAIAALGNIPAPIGNSRAAEAGAADLSVDRKDLAQVTGAPVIPVFNASGSVSHTTTSFDSSKSQNSGGGSPLAQLLDDLRKAKANGSEGSKKKDKKNDETEGDDREGSKPPKDSNKIVVSNPNRIKDGQVDLSEPRFLIYMRDDTEQLVLIGTED